MTLEDLAWAVEDVRSRLKPYATARAYDLGNHHLTFATDKFLNTFGALFREFADNLCDDVVDALSDRLQIVSWSSTLAANTDPADIDPEAPDAGADDLTKAVAEFWERSNGESRVGGVHRNGVREGDGFVIVQAGPDGKAQPWKQRPEQMAVRYSSEYPDQIDVAGKVWRQGKRFRATLYYPDGLVERYATKGMGSSGEMPQARAFKPLQAGDPDLVRIAGEGEDLTYADETGEGMPVFHYPNGECGEYGRSVVLKVLPLQDALNKSVADMLVAMEFHAYPQRWATGVQVEKNDDGSDKSPFAAGEGRLWRVGDKDAEFGQFDVAQMDGFLKVQDGFRLEIGRKGALPPHALNLQSSSSGTPPTGISLLVSEGRTIKWARDRQRDWGQTHRAMVAYGLVLEGHTGVTGKDLSLQWAPPETRDMKALLEEAAMKLDLGVSKRQVLLELGYSPEQVTKFLADQEAEGEEAELARQVLAGGRRQATQGDALGIVQGTQPAETGDTEAA